MSSATESPRSCSQAGIRRTSNRALLHSDCPLESAEEDSPNLGQRSVSLTTLQPAIIQPRMAQLETLEAKMASIEVSLSSTPRRKRNGSIGGVSLGSMRSIPKELASKELENLRNALRDKENIIQSLKGQLTIPGLRLGAIRNNGNNKNCRELSENEKKHAEERLGKLKIDVDNKRLAIKNLKMALERLDITDNIDVRIQQAELEYQLGREELNLLTLLEETRALQLCLEESNRNLSELGTLYSCVKNQEQCSLVAVEIEFDPKSPKFGASQKESAPGLWIDWALDESGLCKEDRLIEVNGKIVLTKNRDDLARLLSAAPDPAQIVVLRQLNRSPNVPSISNNYEKEVAQLRSELDVVRERAEEAQKAKDGFRTDNIRLTHRISYLEEQVAELLSRRDMDSDVRIVSKSPVVSTVKQKQNVTNINISSQSSTPCPSSPQSSKEVQVFQKGPQVTALIANIPGLDVTKTPHTALPVRSKSSLSNVSSTHIPSPTPHSSDYCPRNHKHRHHRLRNGLHATLSSQTLDQPDDKFTYKKHSYYRSHSREKDYNSETNYPTETRYKRLDQHKPNPADVVDQSYQKATKIVQDLTKNRDSLYEKHRQKCLTASEKYNGDILRHYNARKSTSVLDFRSDVHLGYDAKCEGKTIGYADGKSVGYPDGKTVGYPDGKTVGYPDGKTVGYSDSKSAEDLDAVDKERCRLFKKQNSRSAKSLDFEEGRPKSTDYTSEPIEKQPHHGEYVKPRPTPPKKPLRLSLHKTQSLQSVEAANEAADAGEGRKCMKRNHKGGLTADLGADDSRNQSIKWNGFSQSKMKSLENGLENGSWC